MNPGRAEPPAVRGGGPAVRMPDGPGQGYARRHGPPGRRGSPEEAAAAMSGLSLDAEAAARFAERLAQISASDLVPSTSDAQARAHLARRRATGRGAAGGPAPRRIAAPEAPRIAGPAQPRLPAPRGAPAEVPAPPAAAAGPAVPAVVPAGPAQGAANLPAAMGLRDVAEAAPEWGQTRWWNVYDVPQYLRGQIRALGERTFMAFPCYADHVAAARGAGEDPLGSINILANLNGNGPNGPKEINEVAGWIRDNGVLLAAHQMAFPTMAGYEPRVVVAAHGATTYLLVEELVETGAPQPAQYVYAWKGGMDFYHANPWALAGLRGMRPVAGADARGVGAPALPPPRPVFHDVVIDPAAERRRRAEHVKALPQAGAPPVSSSLLQALRGMGFRTAGTPAGPVLRLASGDDTVEVSPEPGRSLAGSTYMRVRRVEPDGNVASEAEVWSVEEAQAFLDAEPAASPAP